MGIKYWQKKSEIYNGNVLDVMIFNELTSQCEPERNIQPIVKYIDQAQHSIDLAMYTLTLFQIVGALQSAQERGVRLRIITDHEMMCSTSSKLLDLKDLGFEIRVPKSNMMHHKFMVIDGHKAVKDKYGGKIKPGSYRSLLLTGSINWTFEGTNGNWENCIASSDRVMTTSFEREFDEMWNIFKTI